MTHYSESNKYLHSSYFIQGIEMAYMEDTGNNKIQFLPLTCLQSKTTSTKNEHYNRKGKTKIWHGSCLHNYYDGSNGKFITSG